MRFASLIRVGALPATVECSVKEGSAGELVKACFGR